MYTTHLDQTGFVPTCLIFDPICSAEAMCAYTDFIKENGVIVALDQEKVYDTTENEYLLKTLKTFCLPDLFTNILKALYKTAKEAS